NVAGYDLPKLHVGALGTVGVIVEATFKVRPRPAAEEAVVVACRSAREAADAALAVRDSDAAPLWLEVAGAGGLPEGPGEGAASCARRWRSRPRWRRSYTRCGQSSSGTAGRW